MANKEKEKVIACIDASPERLTDVIIYRTNDNKLIRVYHCFARDIGYLLSLDDDEYDYQDFYLIGPQTFCKKIVTQIQNYYSEPKIHLNVKKGVFKHD